MDEETGWVVLRAGLDYELMRRFTLTVLARDGGGEETTGRIRVNVLDVNDNAPLFQKEAYVGSLRENEQAVQPVARVRVRPLSFRPQIFVATCPTVVRNGGFRTERTEMKPSLLSCSYRVLLWLYTEEWLRRCAGHQPLPHRKQTHTGAVVTNGSAFPLIAPSRERLLCPP